ncbi:MAG: hypothetical protein NC413_10660 [Muribaculum sp.]|nr:hypothetical protein [Muribaculum sp.]
MKDIIEIFNSCPEIGLKSRTKTEGKEIELVREYIDFRKNTFEPTPEKKMAIFLEPKVGDAFPDIIFIEYNPQNYQNWNISRNYLEKKDLKMLYHIYLTNGIQLEGLVSQLGVTWKDAGVAIEKLYDAGLIYRHNGKWLLCDVNKMVVSKLQAVEAKINKWDEVLQQSIINKSFASESYALLGISKRPKKEIVDKFSHFGIGLCYKEGNSFKTIKKAKAVNGPLNFNSIMFNEWIGRILHKGEEFVYVNG